MAEGAPNPQVLVALAARLGEVTDALRETAVVLKQFRKDLPGMKSADIFRRADEFEAAGKALGKRAAEIRALAFRITRGERRLTDSLADYPEPHRAEVVEALARFREEAAALKSDVSSLGYVAGTHLVFLDSLLRCVGEVTGLQATYHPRKPAMPSVKMGIVDRTA